MKNSLFLFLLLCMGFVHAQTQVLSITNTSKNKEVILNQNKRVIVKTIDGKRIKGRLKIIDNETISLKGTTISLNEIVLIRKNPLLVSLLLDGVVFYFGGATFAVGAIIAAFIQAGYAGYLVASASLITLGIISPKVTKGYKSNKGYKYKIVSSPVSEKTKKITGITKSTFTH